MQTATEFAEVSKFRFDAEIEASDGAAGKLASVFVDAEQRIITHIGVKLGFFGSDYILPLSVVAASTAAQVTLTIPLDDIKKIHSGTGDMKLTAGTTVAAAGKSLGKLRQVTIHRETHVLRHLVIDRPMRGEVSIPASAISGIGKQITVDLGGVSPERLTPFRPDADLHADIYKAIYDYQPLRIDLPGIDIRAIDGSAWLFGHVSSDLNQRLVTDQLQGIPGLAAVHNHLVADNNLASAVSLALARDPRTAGERVGVYPRLGEVRLRGNVRSAAAREGASEVAQGVPGIKSVINELHINPNAADVVPVMASVTNSEDLVPGGR